MIARMPEAAPCSKAKPLGSDGPGLASGAGAVVSVEGVASGRVNGRCSAPVRWPRTE
jgi:hypothetical protein